MRRYIIITFLLLAFIGGLNAQTVNVHSGKVKAERNEWKHLPLFSAYKGDKIKFDIKADHKRRTAFFQVVQYPGNVIVYSNSDVSSDSHEFIVPDNALYSVWYKGPNIDVILNVERIAGKNAKDKPLEWQLVSTPDTAHKSEFREVKIGANVRYKAKTKKVKVNEFSTSEIVSNHSFALVPTASSFYHVEVPNSFEDDYFKKELTGFKVTLTVGDEAYQALKGVVTDGLTAAAGKVASAAKSKASKKISKKKDPGANYEFVDDIEEEQDKMENAQEILELSSEAASVAGEGTSKEQEANIAGDGLGLAGYVIEEGGLKQVLVKEGLKQVGGGELSVEGITGYDIPSVGDLAGKAAGAITPKIKDKVHVTVKDVETDQFVIDKTVGYMSEEIPLDGTKYKIYTIKVRNIRELKDSKNLLTYLVSGNMMMEAEYKITEYADMVFFDPEEEPVMTKKFFKEFEENSEVRVVFADQVKPWETVLSPDEVEIPRPYIHLNFD
ncbi:hypothetical protein [Marinilabilia rubra]|uniref:Uncharacterized protein n=1 Tax=Marinilabilia rubra TaxID=2162893 RepID=A0A2U2BC96_9BACT|nr:hypothetical protein [Marinilabilia rubra]PWE00653.1 hypothetical protein DDZ16_03390 [Marinilabilia rubra]